MEIGTIIGAVIGLCIGLALVRYLRRTWWGRYLFAKSVDSNNERDHTNGYDHEFKDGVVAHLPDDYPGREAIIQDTCYGNMGLGLGPKKPDA